MKIIDAHLHMKKREGFEALCLQCGHENSLEHLLGCFDDLEIAGAVVMGSSGGPEEGIGPGLFNLGGPVDLKNYNYPNRIAFCAGVNPQNLSKESDRGEALRLFEEALDCPHCVGIKVYTGYQHLYPYDERYHPYYELAEKHGVPVVFHTGDTASASGRLRFSHPLNIDDVAVLFPRVRFVMAHFGNPWLADAAEVAKKNPNVYLDLSGLAVGMPNSDKFALKYHGYVQQLRTWLGYLDDYSKVLYGSDWPLVNLSCYIELVRSIIPKGEWDRVFYENALEVFSRLKELLPG